MTDGDGQLGTDAIRPQAPYQRCKFRLSASLLSISRGERIIEQLSYSVRGVPVISWRPVPWVQQSIYFKSLVHFRIQRRPEGVGKRASAGNFGAG